MYCDIVLPIPWTIVLPVVRLNKALKTIVCRTYHRARYPLPRVIETLRMHDEAVVFQCPQVSEILLSFLRDAWAGRSGVADMHPRMLLTTLFSPPAVSLTPI